MREREDVNRTGEAGNRDEVEGVVASTLNLFCNGASPLANAFGVVFIDWLDLCVILGLGRSTNPSNHDSHSNQTHEELE